MKRPIDLLLTRHQGAWHTLASTRRRALLDSLPRSRPLWWRTLIVESFAPLRLAWSALAACWILILLLQLSALNQRGGSMLVPFPTPAEYMFPADSTLIAQLTVRQYPTEGAQ